MSKNVLILASPRSASTLLLLLLGKFNQSRYYPELFLTPDVEERLKLYNSISEKNKSLVLKLMYIHLHRSITNSQVELFKEFLHENKFYTIRLWRNDLREQVFSWTIASTCREFSFQTPNKIECPYDIFYNAFNFILDCQIYLKDNYFNIPIDQEISYDDMISENIMVNNINIGNSNSLEPTVSRPSLPKSEKVLNLDDMNRWYDELEKTYQEKVTYVNRL